MIFNIAVLKRMMKTAYKGAGLLVGNNGDQIIIGGTYWRAAIEERYFPNKARAALVELIGQLPQIGESFRCTSAGNQMEMPGEDINGLIEDIDWNNSYKKTEILITDLSSIRPYQSDNSTILLNEVFTELIDGQPEKGEDCTVLGPCKRDRKEKRVFFTTDTCILEAYELIPNLENKTPDKYYTALMQMESMIRNQASTV